MPALLRRLIINPFDGVLFFSWKVVICMDGCERPDFPRIGVACDRIPTITMLHGQLVQALVLLASSLR